MSFDPAKPLGESLGVAVFASGTDFRAAADWVPGGVSPFDRGVLTHSFVVLLPSYCKRADDRGMFMKEEHQGNNT
jgi:hypothetical protein